MMERYSFDIGWQTLFRVLVFVFLAYIFIEAREVFGALFFAVVLALGIDPMVSFLEKRKIHRILGTLVVFLLAGGFLFSVLYTVVPIIAAESVGLLSNVNSILFSFLGIRLPTSLVLGLSDTITKVLGVLGAEDISFTVALSALFSKVVLALAVVISAFYLSVEKDGTERLLRAILPDAYERSVLTIFARFKLKVRRWLGAQLALSFFVGTMVSVGLWILGVRYPIALGLLAAVFEVVPIIGPLLAGGAAFIVAMTESVKLGFYVVLFVILLQQFENNVLVPIITGKTMKVHPVIVLISLLAGAHIAGFLGVVLAVPSAVLVHEVFNYLAEQKAHRSRRLV